MAIRHTMTVAVKSHTGGLAQLPALVKTEDGYMKKPRTTSQGQDDLRPEYDFIGVPGVRGKHAKARGKGYTREVHQKDGTKEITYVCPLAGSVVLDPDVQIYFPDADAVNRALRGLIALIPTEGRKSRQTTR